MPKFSTPRGMVDILPEEWPYWNFVQGHAIEVARLFGYRRIETPNLGETGLFSRATGAGTDIVDKEMYSFRDRGGDELSLRPEGTAPVMRAYLQHAMDRQPQPVKLFMFERMYRYDRPQRGRLREHRQFDCEAIGSGDAFVDVEMMSLLDFFYRRIGLDDIALHINSIGDPQCRPAYLDVLVAYLRSHESALAPQDSERVERNPLRVLDSKEQASQSVIQNAPHLLDYLCDECAAHWQKVLRGLEIIGIEFHIDHRLVRGLDYYTRTVFEFMPPVVGAQSVIGAGGRYDALAEAMGAKHVPGIGFGTGLERLILNVRERGVELPPVAAPGIFLAHQGTGTEDATLLHATNLRRSGVPADLAFGDRSLRAQMKHADSSGAQYVGIVGEEELQEGAVMLRSLRDGQQTKIPAGQLQSVLDSSTIK